jgi:peptidoglycan hydrolase-like protein with peptidoglycan-binding domain
MGLASICGRVIVCTVLAILLTLTDTENLGAQEQLARAANLAAARTVFEDLSESDRKAMQDALIWTGQYNGVPDGTFGQQTFDAIAAYQQSRRKAPTGSLGAAERTELQSAAQRARAAAGFVMLDDARTGARIGIPTKVLSKTDLSPTGGTRWQSADDRVTLDTRTGPPNATLQLLYDRNVAIQAVGRVVTYKVLRPNFLVIAGETGTGKFYTRYDAGDAGIRGFSIGYDKALASQLDRLVVAIANSFDPFGSAPVAAVPHQPPASPAVLPPLTAGRRMIGTGIALAPRRVLTTVQPGPCGEMKVGDVAVSVPQPRPANTSWNVLDLAGDLPAAIAGMKGAPVKIGDPVLVLSYAADDPRSLTVVAGVMADELSVFAPLQAEAGGAPVVDGKNQLLGIVWPVSSARKVAGIMTTSRHAIIPVDALAPSFPLAGASPETIGAAATAAFWKPVLVPITCAL